MARYIDTDLIKTVVYPPIPKEEETDSEYFYRCGWQDGIGKVLELPTADVAECNRGEWIPCSERIPEYGMEVLTYNSDDEYEINHIIDEDDREWFFDGAVAWMPLPSPYTERGKDGEIY